MNYPMYHNKPNLWKRVLWKYYARKYAKKCKGCNKEYMPFPYYQRIFPRASHYPNTEYCGFCVYDMDSYEASKITYDDIC